MKKHLFILVVLTLLMCFNNAYALDSTCTNSTKVELNKEGYKVEAGYEFNYSTNTSFNLNIYNITNNLYVEIYDESNDTTNIVYGKNLSNGTYTFTSYNTTEIIKYKITVKTNVSGCDYAIKTFNLIKPMKNEYSLLKYCQNEEMKDYVYCKEWLTSYFNTGVDIRENIIKKYNETITTKMVEEEKKENDNAKELLIRNIIFYVILVLIFVVAILDILFIIKMIKKVRKERKMEEWESVDLDL